MEQDAPYRILEKLPPKREKIESIKILREANKGTVALAELKGIVNTIPNQSMLVNAIVLQEAKGSSEIENIITTQDELYQDTHHTQNVSANQAPQKSSAITSAR